MSKYVVIDTETSGLFDFSKPADADGQPRLAELAMIFCDEALHPEREYAALVRPDGWAMDAALTKIHGLTQDRLLAEGRPVVEVLAAYTNAVDWGCIAIAFNAQYDTKILRGELRRAGLDDRFESTPNIDCMRPLTGVCRMLVANRDGSPKINKDGTPSRAVRFPKLAEAYRHFYKTDPPDGHTALGDARACLAIAQAMRRIGILPEPAVHYAKNKPDAAPAPERAVSRSPITGAPIAGDAPDIF